MIFKNDKVYNILKWLVLTFFPAFIFFAESMVDVWAIPYGSKIVMTIAAFTTFLGTLLGIGSVRYAKKQKTA